ncbi:DUF2062 domain-containing protein [Desulfonatronum sp. SC1]|uniref:DUF2062 domain-containing protein n=1 Tax=Desulfonatronum sp. SC1 TaxID=2109626 RepID=UPI000D30B494|nr:DUF2062 domain-containing protein [Desulfonatronum sp. SC1]PTN38124.1 DUF2062 domain-containing protein [Desulfonatronum sp. SC1]
MVRDTERNREPRILVVVPVYNHGATLRQVVEGVLAVHPDVLVVDDGSTDQGLERIADLPVQVRTHRTNQGKGAAVRTAAEAATALGATHIVTIDADGQHDPGDLPRFLDAVRNHPLAVIVGARDFAAANVPRASRFGRRFSNFWLRVQTGRKLLDTQSGFRAYPVALFEHLKFTETRYAFEVEVLVRSAWAGLDLLDVPVRVHYPPAEQRVSHFRAFMDNVRISWLNTRLTLRSMLPWPHRRIIERTQGSAAISVIRPIQSLKILLREAVTPSGLARAAFLGVFLGTLPLVGIHTMAILFTAGYLGQNRVVAVAASQLCMPPLVPALCIEVGHYLRHGSWLTEFTVQTLGHQAPARLWEWVLGSLVLAPILAALVAATTFVAAHLLLPSIRRGPKGSDAS